MRRVCHREAGSFLIFCNDVLYHTWPCKRETNQVLCCEISVEVFLLESLHFYMLL